MELDEIIPGCKIEVTHFAAGLEENKIVNTYKSSLFSVVEDDVIEITTPMKKGHLAPLHQGIKYKFVFITDKGLVRADGVVIDRYKNQNFYLIKVQLLGKLSKYQRREFYRVDCLVPTRFIPLKEEDLDFENMALLRQNIQNKIDLGERKSEEYGTIIDISGGGIKFTAPYSIKEDEYCLFDFDLALDSGIRHVELIGKCVGSDHIEDTDQYSHRIRFDYRFEKLSQEVIVRYIFELERKRRRKEREV